MATQMSNFETINDVITGLTSLIKFNLAIVATEQESPVANTDVSDDLIDISKGKVIILREMRDKFENLISGAIL